MALVAYPYWSVEYRFVDNNNNSATTGVNFPIALTLAEVQNAATQVANRLVALSDAVLVSYTITTGYREDAAIAPPDSSEVERKLVIPLNTALRQGATKLEVPSPIFGLEVDGTDVVDPANPALQSLLDWLVNGAVGEENGPITYYGAGITSAGTPYIRHRARRITR